MPRLLRLWWVPQGDTAVDGAFSYPVDDPAIYQLESQRQQMVIGEDLAPCQMKSSPSCAITVRYLTKVFYFERAPDSGFIHRATIRRRR